MTTKKTAAKKKPTTPTPAAPANDTKPPPPVELAPLFDVPEEGIALPLAALDGGCIEAYRYRDQNGKLVPAYTLELEPRATVGHIIANRGGGKYLLRAKDPSGRIVAVRRLDIEGAEIEPTPAKGSAAASRVDSVQAGAGFRLAIAGLTPEQQQQWMMLQGIQLERQAETERARQADADRHTREMERLEKLSTQTMNLLVTALTTKRGSPDEESATVKDLRAIVRDQNGQLQEMRDELKKTNKELLATTVDLNSKTGDGEMTMREVVALVVENADTVVGALRTLGITKKKAPRTKELPAGNGNGSGEGA